MRIYNDENRKKRNETGFGDYLRALRARKGMSLRAVENATGISHICISGHETGRYKAIFPPDTLRKLAIFYDSTVEDMLTAAGYYDKFEDLSAKKEADEVNRLFSKVLVDRTIAFQEGIDYLDEIDEENTDTAMKKLVVSLYKKIMEK